MKCAKLYKLQKYKNINQILKIEQKQKEYLKICMQGKTKPLA